MSLSKKSIKWLAENQDELCESCIHKGAADYVLIPKANCVAIGFTCKKDIKYKSGSLEYNLTGQVWECNHYEPK